MAESREVGPHNLARLAEDAYDRRGDYESLWFEGAWHRSGELLERSRRVAGGLAELGLRPNERVVVTMPNGPEVGVAYGAVWRAGAVVTPAIFLLATDELAHILRDAEASGVVTSPELLDKVLDASAAVESVRFVVVAGEGAEGRDGVVRFASLAEADPAPIAPRAEGDLAVLLYTGGTTGRAKGVMLTHENVWSAGKAGDEAAYVPGVTRGLVTLPLSHAYGLLLTVVSMQAREPPVTILMRWFQADRFLQLVQEHRVQTSALVPSMLQALLEQPLEHYELSSLCYLVSGAAPLAPDVVAEAGRRLPGVEIREGYGLTETSALVSTNPPGRVRAGSVGVPPPGAEIRIVGEDGRELAPREVGEVCCRSRFVMSGYWRDPELTSQTLRDGWLHTGDMGYVDEDGYLFIVDRKKDLIIRDGFNVFPRDVEDALLEHPTVARVGVVGRPDPVHGEEVVAFVSARPGCEASADELVAFGKERIGAHKYPRDVRIVGSLPLTPIGKVDRKALRALL